MNFQEYIKPELFILIPVLYFIGMAIKKSAVKDKFIPFILGAIGIFTAGLYLLTVFDFDDGKSVATALFTAITQGVLCAAASVYVDQLIKQSLKTEDAKYKKENEDK